MFEFCSPVPEELGGVGNRHPEGALTPLDFLLHMPPRAVWEVGFRLGRTGVDRQFNFEQLKTGNQVEVTVSVLKSFSVPSETTGRPR